MTIAAISGCFCVDGNANTGVTCILMVSHTVFLCDSVARRSVQCKKERTQHRALWHIERMSKEVARCVTNVNLFLSSDQILYNLLQSGAPNAKTGGHEPGGQG